MTRQTEIVLFIDPFTYHYENDRLFDIEGDRLGGDANLAPFVYLRDWFKGQGIRVHTADRFVRGEIAGGRNLFVSFGMRDRYRKLAKRSDIILSAFFAFEGPIVEPALYLGLADVQDHFKRVYTFTDAESLAPFLSRPLRCERFTIPQSFESVHEEIWRQQDRGFMVMINGNKKPPVQEGELYTERMRAVEHFGRTGEIDLYGVGWDGPAYVLGKPRWPGTLLKIERNLQKQWQRFRPDPLLVAARRAYKGIAVSKSETLGMYNFSICFENQILNGWITEKIFNCFFAGTVPIYLGAPDIESYVPRECFVDMRQFGNYEELRRYLKSLSSSEIRQYKENSSDYLTSAQYRPFTKTAFTELVARVVEEDAGINLLPETAGRVVRTGAGVQL